MLVALVCSLSLAYCRRRNSREQSLKRKSSPNKHLLIYTWIRGLFHACKVLKKKRKISFYLAIIFQMNKKNPYY